MKLPYFQHSNHETVTFFFVLLEIFHDKDYQLRTPANLALIMNPANTS